MFAADVRLKVEIFGASLEFRLAKGTPFFYNSCSSFSSYYNSILLSNLFEPIMLSVSPSIISIAHVLELR